MVRAAIIISLRNDSTMERVSADVPKIISVIQSFSDKSEMIFRSNDGCIFGWFIRTDAPFRVIQSAIRDGRHFVNGDSILIFEIGEALDGLGFSRQWTWLQRTAK